MKKRLSWKGKLDLIRRRLDSAAHLRYPDVNGNWYMNADVWVEDTPFWNGGGFNAATPAKCVGDAYAAYTSGKTLLLGSRIRVAWDGEAMVWR